MPWLLDPSHPNLHWRVLTDLVRRPPGSPAVVRARGGANAVDPVASLIEDLMPDGSWVGDAAVWEMGSGPGWRLVAAAQCGADASDPRLHAAANRLLDEAPGSGGFALGEGRAPSSLLTARVLQALAVLGWCRHIRFQEAVAWLDEKASRSVDGGWLRSGEVNDPGACEVTPVALLDALTTCGSRNRDPLTERCAASVRTNLAAMSEGMYVLGHPNLDRTDAAESFAVLARAGAGWDPEMLPALVRLQGLQLEGGRWARDIGVPESLPIGRRPRAGEPSKWITLTAATAVLHYAVEAGLPRKFPQKPSPILNS
jgi:hypothetical protein